MICIDMKMPEVCANFAMNFWNRCRILERNGGEGRIEDPSNTRLAACPLIPLEDLLREAAGRCTFDCKVVEQ